MNKRLASVAFAAAVMAGVAAPLSGAQAVSITNGSFESASITPDSIGFTTIQSSGPNANSITGWTVTAGSIDYIGSYWTASDGVRSLDMNGLSACTISQTITGLTVGNQYKITFDLAGNTDAGPTIKTLGVTAALNGSSYNFDTTGSSRTNMGWLTQVFNFTATGSSATLSFASLVTAGGTVANPDAFGPALDNVAILDFGNAAAATPLPASWSMMLIGFATFGGLGVYRRRRLTAARAQA